MGFEVMNSMNPELSWKTVTKGRRTRKSMARCMNSVAKAGNSPSPRRVGNFTESDSDKFGEDVPGRLISGKSESVPIKKRRNLLQPPPSHALMPSLGSPERKYDVGDFSGIELLAAAASMDDAIEDTKNGDLVVGHSLILKNSDASSSEAQGELGLKSGESESSLSNMTVNEGNTDCLVLSNSVTVSHSSCGQPVDVTMPKVDRRHWDLNTLMDMWDKPFDDSVASNTSTDDKHIEDKDKYSAEAAREVSDQATVEDACEVNPHQVLSSDTQKDTSDQVLNIDAIPSSSVSNLCWPSGMSMSEEKINTTSVKVAMSQREDCSSIVQCNNIKDPWKACEPPGAISQDCQSVQTSGSRLQNDEIFVPHCTIADSQGHVEPAELVAKHEGNNLHNEGSRISAMEDSCKSSVAQAQCDGDPTSSTGKIGSSVDAQHDLDVSQNHKFHVVDGVGLTKYQDGYDSPYEDGELRGSFLHSWEDNELEDECADYESDGRNGDGSDAVDYHNSAIAEGSECIQLHEGGGSKSGSVKQYLSMHFVKDDSDNNERAGRGSTAGSGTTVQGTLEMDIKENNDSVKRRHLNDRRDTAQMYGYPSKTVRGKLQSRIEGWSYLDTTDGKDAFMQECRSRQFSASYSQPERDTHPGKYPGRYRPYSHGERDGVHHSTSWGSRRHYSSSCHRAESRRYTMPENITGNSDRASGFGFHDSRQTDNYLSKGLHRPIVRSPEESDGYFGIRRKRTPLTWGVGNHRSRGHYLHCAEGDFMQHCEPLPDEANIPIQLSRYLSTKKRRFCPNSGRSAHIPLQFERSRPKSRMHSPEPWHFDREQFLSTRRHSRSPDFRSGTRIERTRVPFGKPPFTSDFREGYISPSKGCPSPPQRNCRWVEDGVLADNHSGHRRSAVRVFRRTQRFDVIGSSG